MGSEDLNFKVVEERRLKRKRDELRRKERAQDAETQSTSAAAPYLSMEETDLSSESDEDDQVKVSRYHHQSAGAGISSHDSSKITKSITPNLKKRCLINNPLFVASLDRTKTTTRSNAHCGTGFESSWNQC